jgi:hypothetical protein
MAQVHCVRGTPASSRATLEVARTVRPAEPTDRSANCLCKCPERDSNPQGLLHQILSLARLPIPPPGRRFSYSTPSKHAHALRVNSVLLPLPRVVAEEALLEPAHRSQAVVKNSHGEVRPHQTPRATSSFPNRLAEQVRSKTYSGQRLFRGLPNRGLLRAILLVILSAQVDLVND